MESERNQWLLLRSSPFVVLFTAMFFVLVSSLYSIVKADAPGATALSKLEIEQFKGNVLESLNEHYGTLIETVGDVHELERDLDELDRKLGQLEQRITNLEAGSAPQVTSPAPLPLPAPSLPPVPRSGLEKPLPLQSEPPRSELLEAIRKGIGLRKTEKPSQRQTHSSSPIFQQLSARRMQLGYEDSDSEESSEWEE